MDSRPTLREGEPVFNRECSRFDREADYNDGCGKYRGERELFEHLGLHQERHHNFYARLR